MKRGRCWMAARKQPLMLLHRQREREERRGTATAGCLPEGIRSYLCTDRGRERSAAAAGWLHTNKSAGRQSAAARWLPEGNLYCFCTDRGGEARPLLDDYQEATGNASAQTKRERREKRHSYCWMPAGR